MLTVLEKLEQTLGKGRIKKNEPLARYTTLRVGGTAKYYFTAHNREELLLSLLLAIKSDLPYYVLGGGSNVVISDQGFPGLMIRNESREIKIIKRIGKITSGKTKVEQALVQVDTGVLVNQLVRFTCDEGLGGLERHLGLPGTVGGALYMNSKWTRPISYVGDVLYQAEIATHDGRVQTVNRTFFNFGYDQSILQKTHDTVLRATFLLNREDTQILWDRADASMIYRRKTQPMGVATAGCTFRNISLGDALRIGTPDHTTSAGFLVDQVDLKNFTIGKAKYSDKHANFILNLGGATAQEVKELIDEAKRRVKGKFAVEIIPEIVLLGKFNKHG